jgi:hypothetical protein
MDRDQFIEWGWVWKIDFGDSMTATAATTTFMGMGFAFEMGSRVVR